MTISTATDETGDYLTNSSGKYTDTDTVGEQSVPNID